MHTRLPILAVIAIAGLALFTGHALSQSGESDTPEHPPAGMPSADEMKAFQEYAKLMQPSAKHKELERFLGTWEQTTRIWMLGPNADPMESKAEVTNRWLVDGLWMIGEGTGKKTGNPMVDAMAASKSLTVMGYDNYKKKFVTFHVHDKTSAMSTGFGNLTRDGSALISYGTIDEPMTGEHDNMVKYVWRFHDADHHVLEIHDLAIGEQNTKVVEMEFRRKP